jgi:hypothetical protein
MMTVAISGVPFCSSSKVVKFMCVQRPRPGLMIWRMKSQALEVPYGNSFFNYESWRIVSTSDTAVKCILRASDLIDFVKSTFFESKIRSRSGEEYIEHFKFWRACIDKRGYMKQVEQPRRSQPKGGGSRTER